MLFNADHYEPLEPYAERVTNVTPVVHTRKPLTSIAASRKELQVLNDVNKGNVLKSHDSFSWRKVSSEHRNLKSEKVKGTIPYIIC